LHYFTEPYSKPNFISAYILFYELIFVSRLKNNPIPLSGATNLSAESPEYIFFLLFKETEFFEYFERIFKTYPGSLFLGKLNPTKVDTYINLVSYNLFNFLKNPHVSFQECFVIMDLQYTYVQKMFYKQESKYI